MGRIYFRYLNMEEKAEILPQMFDILYTNMNKIAPSGCGYDADQEVWLSYASQAVEQNERQVVLMYVGEELAGYFQYSLVNQTLIVEEVEIKPKYQRSMVFFRCCQHLVRSIKDDVHFVESYVNKGNENSLSIHRSLQMEIVGENKSGTSWHFRGDARRIAERFLK